LRPAGADTAASVMAKSGNSVLVIDNEPQVRRFVSAGLELHGYTVKEADTGAAGLGAAVQIQPDVILLDLDLPDMSGIEVLESVRAWSNVPVIVISLESAEEQKVMLLKSGADDYMVKPFGIAELAARCEAALRRYYKSADKNPIMRTGSLAVDLVSRSVTLGKERIMVTKNEYRLLHILASNLDLVVTHQQLVKEVWGNASGDNVQYLRMLVRQVRQKIEPEPNRPQFLVTESGVGYCLKKIDS
jgi:two-component system, OmpR family, KDP operon response regulator KdpE